MTRTRLVLAAIVALALVMAWSVRFGCDDAYISFVYARNLVRGNGLTWFGDHVEGYTNFAWVLWIAAGIEAGVDPLVWAWIGSLSALSVAIVATYGWVRMRTDSDVAASCAAGLLATNFTFLAFGTSGLETMLQTALLTVATLQTERIGRGDAAPRRLALLSVVVAFAIWTRLDSAVIGAVLACVVGHRLVRTRASARAWIATIAPAAVLIAGWMAWKLAYYGDVLPNTFHAKVAVTSTTLGHGVTFIGAFLHAYLLWPALLGVAVLAFVRRQFSSRLPAAIVVAWLGYIVVVGGDFMEFRFFVPIMPALFAIIAEAITIETMSARVPDIRIRALATVAFAGALSWRHAAAFDGMASDRSYDSVRALATFYDMLPDEDWERPGRVLRDALVGTNASLSCSGAGAIPYFADLPTVDQLGLNDDWVARNGVRPPDSYVRPGHQRFASYEYLVIKKVTFVIGSPVVVDRGLISTARLDDYVLGWMSMFLGPAVRPVPVLDLVAAPLTDRSALLMWYLTPTPEISARIEAAGWERRRIKLSFGQR